jgi:hypothetical protein
MLARTAVARAAQRALQRPVLARSYSLLRPDVFGDQQNQMDYQNRVRGQPSRGAWGGDGTGEKKKPG